MYLGKKEVNGQNCHISNNYIFGHKKRESIGFASQVSSTRNELKTIFMVNYFSCCDATASFDDSINMIEFPAAI